MAGLAQFNNQTYLNLKTFRKNGEAMPTPVWFAQEGDKIYIRTIAGSGKVKRINHNPRVEIMPCGQMGEPMGEWVAGRARELTDEATYHLAKSLVVAKYGELVQTLEDQAVARGNRYTVLLVEIVDA